MGNIMEILLSELIVKKNKLETELGRLINDNTSEINLQVTKSLYCLKEISQTYNEIELITEYITKSKEKQN